MNITIDITKKDLKNCQFYETIIQDYPLYGHTSGLTRAEIVLLGKFMELQFLENDTTAKITIETLKKGTK